MIIFAWILWSLFIVEFLFIFAIIIATGIAMGQGKEVEAKFSFHTLFDIVVFIFLTLYLF